MKVVSLSLGFDLLLLWVLIFNLGNTIAFQEFILDTEPIAEPSWSVSSDCEYFDQNENICPGLGANFSDVENRAGYWTSCRKNNCSLIYTARDDEVKPEGFAFRIYGLGASSHLVLSWDSGESRLPVSNNGSWMEYSVIKGGFKGSKTLSLTLLKDSEGIIIFDKIVIQTSNEIVTTTDISTQVAESSSSSTDDPDSSTTKSFDDLTSTVGPTEPDPPSTNWANTQETSTPIPPPQPRLDVLDSINDLGDDSPWKVINCVYGSTVEDLSKTCQGIIRGDPLMRNGYWSPCGRTTCQIIYMGSASPGNSTTAYARQVSFRGFIPVGSQISVTTDKGFEIIFNSEGDWTDVTFFGVNVTDVITFTAQNSGTEQVIFDKIRVKSFEESSAPIFIPGENELSELYLLLILIVVCLVAVLMTALVIITCFRRICCKPRKPKTEEEDSLGMQYQDFRTMAVKLPVPPISPPPGYLHQDYSAGLALQPSTFYLNKDAYRPPPNPKPVPKPEPQPSTSSSAATSASIHYGHGNYGKPAPSASPYGKSTSPYGKGHIIYSAATPTPRSPIPDNKVEPQNLPRLAKINAYSNHPTL